MSIRKTASGQVTEVEGQPGIEKTAQADTWGDEDEQALAAEDAS